MRRWLTLTAWLLCGLLASAQAPVLVTFVWDTEPNWPHAASAQIERAGGVAQNCGSLAWNTPTEWRCTMLQAPGTALFRVRGLNALGQPGDWSAAASGTVPGTVVPGRPTIVRLFRLPPAPEGTGMFSDVGSVESNISGVNSGSDTVSAVAVPNLNATSTQRIGIVLVAMTGATNNPSGATWDGVAMTQTAAEANNTSQSAAIFYLVGAAHNGNYDIVVSYSAAAIHSALITVAWANADGDIEIDDADATTGTTQNPTITSTQAAADGLVVSTSGSAANALGAPVTDVTELQSYDQGGNCMISAYSIPGASGATTHTHNYSQSEAYAIASASFKTAGGGGGGDVDAILLGGDLLNGGLLLGRLIQ